jgi:hypothetical protein
LDSTEGAGGISFNVRACGHGRWSFGHWRYMHAYIYIYMHRSSLIGTSVIYTLYIYICVCVSQLTCFSVGIRGDGQRPSHARAWDFTHGTNCVYFLYDLVYVFCHDITVCNSRDVPRATSIW